MPVDAVPKVVAGLTRGLFAADLERYLASGPTRHPLTPRTLTDAADLRADVERTRAQGFALSLDDVTVGVGAVAVPVLALIYRALLREKGQQALLDGVAVLVTAQVQLHCAVPCRI